MLVLAALPLSFFVGTDCACSIFTVNNRMVLLIIGVWEFKTLISEIPRNFQESTDFAVRLRLIRCRQRGPKT